MPTKPKPDPSPAPDRVPLTVVEPEKSTAFPEPQECEERHRRVVDGWRGMAFDAAKQAVKDSETLHRWIVLIQAVGTMLIAGYLVFVTTRQIDANTHAIERLTDAVDRLDRARR